MRVLITGGAGFIGSFLAEAYLEQGEEVYIIDDLSTGSLENIKHLVEHREHRDRVHVTIESVLNEEPMLELVVGWISRRLRNPGAVLLLQMREDLIGADLRDQGRIRTHVRPEDVVAPGLDEGFEPLDDFLPAAGDAKSLPQRFILHQQGPLLDDAGILDVAVRLRDQQAAIHTSAVQRLVRAGMV